MSDVKQKSQGDNSPNINVDQLIMTLPSNTSSEVGVLIEIISIISNEAVSELDSEEKYDEAVKDFQLKLERFSEQKAVIEKTYQDLLPIYHEPYIKALEAVDLDELTSRKVGLHIGTSSVAALESADGNPVVAFDEMRKDISKQLGKTDLKFDDNAILYYLYAEFMRCTVFPNEGEEA